MNSFFAAILNHSDPSIILAENDFFMAILERKPLVLGHVVVIAKQAKDHLFDLDENALSSLMTFSKPIAKAIQAVIPCQKVGVAVIGLETRHAHLHLVPISSADDLNFTRPKMTVTEVQVMETVEKIRSQLKPI